MIKSQYIAPVVEEVGTFHEATNGQFNKRYLDIFFMTTPYTWG
ncbi:lasso RiPP family leader peptide-containing protein [Leucobacter sp. G161]|nr:lasso RiPP family leader peptide-containing protein [Leucobacter sp. G161]